MRLQRLLSQGNSTGGSSKKDGQLDSGEKNRDLAEENATLRKKLESVSHAISPGAANSQGTSPRTLLVNSTAPPPMPGLVSQPSGTFKTTNRRLQLTTQLSMSSDELGGDDDNPDWIKKYSDQHKRVYWRHKVICRI